MGWFDPSTGCSSWNILIRTAELRKEEGWYSRVTAGGGITIESNPKSRLLKRNGKQMHCYDRVGGWMRLPNQSCQELAIHPLPLESNQNNNTTQAAIHTHTFEKHAVLLIDNLDSFTYNIAHSICGLGIM